MIGLKQDNLDNLTKAELIELLANTKKYSELLEAKIAEPDEFRFKYNIVNCWYVRTHNQQKPHASKGAYLQMNESESNGVYRMDNLRALKASDNIFNNNIIDAIAEQLEPDWKPDFDDLKQEKCSILFNPIKNVYTVLVNYNEDKKGIAIM